MGQARQDEVQEDRKKPKKWFSEGLLLLSIVLIVFFFVVTLLFTRHPMGAVFTPLGDSAAAETR